MTTPKYLTRQQVAALFGVSPGTVTRWAREGRLNSQLTPGGHRRYPRETVQRLLEELQRGRDTPGPGIA